jgi:nitroreductase
MTIQTSTIKKATTVFPVMDLIRKRWSPRSFSYQEISDRNLNTILEGASWAPSANNEQPWLFFPAQKNTARFEAVWEGLMPGNKPWTKKAAVLVVIVGRTVFSNGKPNAYSDHDLGLATGFLLLQAQSLGIFSHVMAGFDKEKIRLSLGLKDSQNPVSIVALGYPDDAEKLEEPFRTRELTPRNRKPLSEILL